MPGDLMPRARFIPLAGILVCALMACERPVAQLSVVRAAPAQQVVDRIVVRIEDDIITLSEMRELAGYQELVDGKTEPDDQLLSELIEQWVVNAEATATQFPPPPDSEVDRETASIESHFADSQNSRSQAPRQTYEQRLIELQMTPPTVRRIVKKEIYLARYLDYKFRPAVQIEDPAIETYYHQVLAPDLAAKKQPLPPLDEVRETIRELLVQQGISERATSWLEDTKSRLNIEIEPDAGVAPSTSSASQ
jgi:hypothetical protein